MDVEHLFGQSISDVSDSPFAWSDDPSRIAWILQACHRRALEEIAEKHLRGESQFFEVTSRLSRLAEEALLASLKLASISSQFRQSFPPTIEPDFAIYAAGRLGASRVDFDSPLELVLLLGAPRRNALTEPSNGRATPAQDDWGKLLKRAMGHLVSPDLFGYSLTTYQEKTGWTAWRETTPTTGLPGAGSAGRVFDPKHWFRDLELHLRADDRQRIVPLRLLIGDSNEAKDTLEYVSTYTYKQYFSAPELAEFGAFYRSLTNASNTSLEQGLRNLEPQAHDASPAFSALRTLNDLRLEFEFLIRYFQLRFGWRLKPARAGDFETAIAALREGEFIDDEQYAVLIQALGFLDDTLLQCGALRLLGQTGNGPSVDVDLYPAAVRHVEGWRMIAEQIVGLSFQKVSDLCPPSIADAVLTPQHSTERIVQYAASLGYKKPTMVADSLRELESEEVSVLSDARCRFYFSRIAATLLERIAGTPSPDQTLEQLIATTRSLGGKGILWQLFDANDACLDLYVRLCGSSPYLTSILATNPGMLDELLDSLMLAKLPSASQMNAVWQELNRGSKAAGDEGIEPLLRMLKNAMHLNVGVREILGHGSIAETHDALTDISDLCVQQIIDSTYEQLVAKHGVPHVTSTGMCPFTIFTFGKYGGREPNYHSDMTLLCLYQSAGKTRGSSDSLKIDPISNAEFYEMLSQRIGQRLNRLSRTGKLFDVKFWNLPNSSHAPLAWSIDLLRDFFLKNPMTTGQKLEFSKARTVYGVPTFAAFSHSVLQALLSQFRWTASDLHAMLESRKRLESTASEFNLKRGAGGTMDVELLAQSLTLAYSPGVNAWEPPSTFNLLSRLSQNQVIQAEHAAALRNNYDFLRSVESGLRLMNTSARHDLPTGEADLDRLAYVLRIENRASLLRRCAEARSENRILFDRYAHRIPAASPR